MNENTLIFVQNNASDYVIIRPENSTEANITATNELQAYIKKMSGVELPVKTDAEQPYGEFEIVVGYTNRSVKGQFDEARLGKEGFVIETVGKKLYIAGSGVRGAIYGVYTFLEEYLGCGFYTSEFEKVPTQETICVQPIERNEQIPVFEYRDIDFVTSMHDGFQVKLKANGRHAPADSATGGRVEYVGGFVHTLSSLVPAATYFESHPEYFALKEDGTRQQGWDYQHCLTNSDVLDIVIQKVRGYLKENPNADIISISQNDSGTATLPCMCPNCRAVYEEEGAYSGAMIRFVNAVAKEFAAEYPNVKFDTLAYRHTRNVCKTRPADNIIVRLCTIECCFSHPLGTCDDVYAMVGAPKSIAEDLADWGKICKNIYVWDYATNFRQSVIFFPNFNSLLPNVRFFADNSVIGVYEEANYFTETCDFPELRSYIMAKILWNPYMSKEKYWGYIDDFLKNVYGKGWRYIREYIDLAQSLVKDYHFGIYEEFTKTVFAPRSEKSDNSTLLAMLTVDQIKNYESTDWLKYAGYNASVSENILTSRGGELFDLALEQATEKQAYRINKIRLQVDFLKSYMLDKLYSNFTDNIMDMLRDFINNTEEGKATAQSEVTELTLKVCDYVKKAYRDVYEKFNRSLYDSAMKYGIARLGEGSRDITDGNVDLSKVPYRWK